MFIETHMSSTENGIPLAFVSSLDVQAFPCGRRRSELVSSIDSDNDGNVTEDDKYYIPFDPEARLNTEANNTRHSGLNGFTQTYLNKWDTTEGLLSLVLAGYLFNIRLSTDYNTCNEFGNAFMASAALSDINAIYANIRIEDTPLFSGDFSYSTGVLRNQSMTPKALTSLDLLKSVPPQATEAEKATWAEKSENYYFSGLSFSASPLSGKNDTRSTSAITTNDGTKQLVVSLCILEKNASGDWHIHYPALLPKIEHGPAVDSVKIGTIYAESIEQSFYDAETGDPRSGAVPILDLVKVSEAPEEYQLQFFYYNG